MTQQDYEQKKRECWDRCVEDVGIIGYTQKLAHDYAFDRAYALGKQFGNSEQVDAEGEEILTVSRKRVQEMYSYNEEILSQDQTHSGAILLKKKLTDLYGSKCLPDENSSNVEKLEKNDEPKYKRGDIVMYDGTVQTIVSENVRCGREYYLSGVEYPVAESDLEPYTEPTDFDREVNFPAKNNLAIYFNKSKNCDNRLQIAAMAMQGILSNGNAIQYAINNFRLQDGSRNRYQAVAECSLAFADALIAESEKRSEHGK